MIDEKRSLLKNCNLISSSISNATSKATVECLSSLYTTT